MTTCPNCTAEIDRGDAYCPNCGTATGGGDESRAGESRTGRDRREQEPHRNQGREQPAAGSRNGQQAQPQARRNRRRNGEQRGPPVRQERLPAGANQWAESGLGRRQLLAYGGGIAVLGGGGWHLFLGDDYPDTPVGVVEERWNAWMQGDFQRFKKLHRLDGPEWEIKEDTRDDFGPENEDEWTIEDRKLVERTETETVVREVEVRDRLDLATERIFWEIELRPANGRWKIWQRTIDKIEEVDE